MNISKKCHFCGKKLEKHPESLFSHCFECNSQRLDQMTIDFDPCQICRRKTRENNLKEEIYSKEKFL